MSFRKLPLKINGSFLPIVKERKINVNIFEIKSAYASESVFKLDSNSNEIEITK